MMQIQYLRLRISFVYPSEGRSFPIGWGGMRDCLENVELSGRCRDNHSKIWSENVKDKVKCRAYKLLKADLGTKDYMKLNFDTSDRSFMVQFRLGECSVCVTGMLLIIGTTTLHLLVIIPIHYLYTSL